jgi:hypothetical protein
LAEQEEYDFAKEKDDDNQRDQIVETNVTEVSKDVEMTAETEETIPEGFVVTKIMTKDERIKAIQNLVSKIPTEKDELWEWNVKWEYLDRVNSFNSRI